MRQYYLALFGILFFIVSVRAQVYNHIVAAGFNTIGYELKPLGNGQWLAVGVGNELPGKSFTDSVIAVVFNDKGEILHQRTLQLPPSGTYGVYAATGAADGGYAIAIAQNGCDVVSYYGTLNVFDQNGKLRWSKSSAGTQWRVPNHLLSTPDGHLLAVYSKKFIKYDLQTGDVLFEAALEFAPNLSVSIRDVEFYPGTEDLVGIGSPNFQYWEKTGPPDTPVYQLTGLETPSYTSLSNLTHGPPGHFYTVEVSTGRVFEFTAPDLAFTEIIDLPFKVYGVAATGQGLVLCCQIDGMSHLLTADFLGQITDTILVSDQWQIAYRMAQQDSVLALIGYGGSGPFAPGQSGYPYNSAQLWLQTRPLPPFKQSEILPDAALTAVSQESAVKITTIYNNPSGQWYVFEGGKFSVQVTNTGSTVLHSVDVLIGFDKISGICSYRLVERRHFSDLSLEPGESSWLDFGNVSGAEQSTNPWQFCFWTAAPNEKPDANHDDDVFCHDVITNTDTPYPTQLSISPNPTSTGFWVNLPGEASRCNLFDLAGRLMQSNEIPAGAERFFVPTANLANGMYWFQLGAFVEKIVVQGN